MHRGRPVARLRIAATAIATLLVGAACGSDDTADGPSPQVIATTPSDGEATRAMPTTSTPTAPNASTTMSPPTTVDGVVAVPATVDFTATAVGGSEIDVAAYANAPIAFWFWSPY